MMGTVFTLLTAVLVVLKLLGFITLSWWWVVLPAFVPVIIGLVAIFTIIVAAIAAK